MLTWLPLTMDNLPKDLKSGSDYSLFISDKEPKWIVNEKSVKKERSVGAFRNDLNKLKVMRREERIIEKQKQPIPVIEIEEEIITTPIILNSKTFIKPLKTLISTPSNPLIDQTVKIIKPTEWIDCISRESKRIFVNDNWIVARILLPTVSKDSIGLKRLTLE